ncbi:MAG: heme exporter protein CcmD [Casimicrobiaceae bacterium]
MNANDFFAMGGYGFFIWGSYAIAALLICAEVVALRARYQAARRAAGDRGRAI